MADRLLTHQPHGRLGAAKLVTSLADGSAVSEMSKRVSTVLVAAAVVTVAGPARADDDPWWGPDKAAHFAAASAIAAGGYALGTAAWPERSRSILLGAGAALLAGALKEGLDAAGLGRPSWRDFAWDAVGAVCGVGIAFTIDVGVHGGTAELRF
jgi:uncharacterized protein YfiM (DUF2279 family)